MSEQPWLKFYPRDWRGDQALRAVSMAARGLWMECLCIMHEAKPYGHLMLNGNPVEDGALARMAGASVDEVSALMAELRQAGVFSLTSRGVVFSRRMTEDHARARKGQRAASKRWAQVSVGEQQSDAPNGLPNGLPNTQKPEARSQKPQKPPDGGDDGFEAWYSAFPRHQGRGHALRAYRSALKKASASSLIQGAERYRALRAGQDPKYTMLPATWLNGEHWADESSVSILPSFVPADEKGWRDRLQAFRAKGHWPAKWGAKPGEPGCKCPPALIAEAEGRSAA